MIKVSMPAKGLPVVHAAKVTPMEGVDGYNTVIKLICCTSI
jgi:hypothetical protein